MTIQTISHLNNGAVASHKFYTRAAGSTSFPWIQNRTNSVKFPLKLRFEALAKNHHNPFGVKSLLRSSKGDVSPKKNGPSPFSMRVLQWCGNKLMSIAFDNKDDIIDSLKIKAEPVIGDISRTGLLFIYTLWVFILLVMFGHGLLSHLKYGLEALRRGQQKKMLIAEVQKIEIDEHGKTVSIKVVCCFPKSEEKVPILFAAYHLGELMVLLIADFVRERMKSGEKKLKPEVDEGDKSSPEA